MKLGAVTRILKEDIARFGDTPTWLDALIGPLNQFMTQVTQGFNNSLTFEDNFRCQKKILTMTSNVEISVETSGNKVTGVLPLFVKNQIIESFGTRLKQDGTIAVTIKLGSPAVDGVTKAELTLLVLY